eukprot:TRINITY_DN206_c0_g1_i1.p1 TRINITY_DN206_c0_g1~~TRINITY_DN206_c0_g1_i1.p1  ORF type:complete len:377 (+),score=26.87 TRINITY_DN206_c0_g1_i1:41-1171(+)
MCSPLSDWFDGNVVASIVSSCLFFLCVFAGKVGLQSLQVILPPWLAYVAVVLCVLNVISWLQSPPAIRLRGKHILIAGGSTDVGRALGCLAVKEGGRISLLGADEALLEESAELVEAAIPLQKCLQELCKPVVTAKARLDDALEVAEAIASTTKVLGPVDILVCASANETSSPCKEVETTPLDDFERVMRANWLATIAAIQGALEHMKDRFGEAPTRIAIISSLASQGGQYGHGAFASSQFALRGLAEVLQQELAAYNIRITFVCPPTKKVMMDGKGYQSSVVGSTQAVAQSAGNESPDSIAAATLRAVKQGRFLVNFGVTGWIVGTLTSGMAPQPFLFQGALEVLFAGVCRSFMLLAHASFFRRVSKREWKFKTP